MTTNAKLVVLAPAHAAIEAPLDHSPFFVGHSFTDDPRDLRLNVDNVTRRHAQLELRDGDWWIVDLGSTHGTWIDGKLVKKKKLRDGMRIVLGDPTRMHAVLELRAG